MATVTGAGGGNFPTTPGAYDRTSVDGDVTLFRLNPWGTRLLYSTFIGLHGLDYGKGITLHADGRATICGHTDADFPVTPGAFDLSYNGGQSDGFVTKFDLQPNGVELHGLSTPSCRGSITMGAYGQPMAPTTVFGLYASGAPPQTSGWLVVGTTAANLPFSTLSTALWVNPTRRLIRVPVQTDVFGYVELPFPVSLGLPGTSYCAQFLFGPSPTCPGPIAWSASHALTITSQ